jgi:hypothetical protein
VRIDTVTLERVAAWQEASTYVTLFGDRRRTSPTGWSKETIVSPLGDARVDNPRAALVLVLVELANLAGDTLQEVIAAAERGVQRIRGTPHLALSFLRHCGLSLW